MKTLFKINRNFGRFFKYVLVCRSVGLSICRSVGLSVSRSDGLSVCRSVGPSVCLSVSRSVGPSANRSVGLSVGLSVSRSLGLSVCLSFCCFLILVCKILIDFGDAFNCSWGSQGCQKGPFWCFWDTLGRHFGVLGWPLAPILGALHAFGAQSLQKPPLLFPRRIVLSDFGAQSDPKRVPK